MNGERVHLHDNVERQEHWRCAWEAVRDFAFTDGVGRYGRNQAMTYDFEAPGETLRVCVWRNKHGLHAALVEEVNHG